MGRKKAIQNRNGISSVSRFILELVNSIKVFYHSLFFGDHKNGGGHPIILGMAARNYSLYTRT